ncbi:MAG: ABC transporter ATP-binding protein [Chloroflexi bacterium]|nr:ABC transporter ATP-binding protein [Chloroflexota bacterium]
MNELLRVENLTVTVAGENGPRRILDQVSFTVQPHEVLGLVGESGSGKTMTSLTVMGLLPGGAKAAGHIWFDGRDLLALSEREMRSVRGSQIAMIFQNPRAALNPLMRVGDQVARVVRQHRDLHGADAFDAAIELLRHVGISDAPTRARAYAHQLSGGMAQRVLVAMMLACRPRLLIADEPTTSLDVTIQAQLFALIKEVQAETGAALLLITHDLGVVAEVCQRVAVMYGGQIMEVAPVGELFARPLHPYTARLMASILRVDRPADLENGAVLAPLPVLLDTPGCHFANRCPAVMPACWERRPAPENIADGHLVVCHQYPAEARK